MLDARTSTSAVRPWTRLPAGSAVCLTCLWARLNLTDPAPVAHAHHVATGWHPVVATAASKEATP